MRSIDARFGGDSLHRVPSEPVSVLHRCIRCLNAAGAGVGLPKVFRVIRKDRMFGKPASVIGSLFMIKVRKQCYAMILGYRPSTHTAFLE